MGHRPAGERLADKNYVTVILRLLLGRQGELEHGEVVDVDGTVRGRFKRWSEMAMGVRNWAVANAERENTDASPGDEPSS